MVTGFHAAPADVEPFDPSHSEVSAQVSANRRLSLDLIGQSGGSHLSGSAVEALASDALIVAHPLRPCEPPGDQFIIRHASPLSPLPRARA
jgi:hypothetical protein